MTAALDNQHNCNVVLRFVVLLHELPSTHERGTHWDLMLEPSVNAEALDTWALDVEPNETMLSKPGGIRCVRLQAHRTTYLSYEGPVSNNRGSVRRWESGTFCWRSRLAKEATLEMYGTRLRGYFRLSWEEETQTESGTKLEVWRLRRVAPQIAEQTSLDTSD